MDDGEKGEKWGTERRKGGKEWKLWSGDIRTDLGFCYYSLIFVPHSRSCYCFHPTPRVTGSGFPRPVEAWLKGCWELSFPLRYGVFVRARSLRSTEWLPPFPKALVRIWDPDSGRDW